MIHYTHTYFHNPPHKITVDLVGLGGTGSQVLNGLARINQSLMKLDHPGLHVRAWDNDLVSDANIGRQLFSPADLLQNKALVLVSRVNRFFGFSWEAMPLRYTGEKKSNILITCVDTAKARIDISKVMSKARYGKEPTDHCFYWLDIGNLQKTGQCVLGSVLPTDVKGMNHVRQMKNVVQVFPQLKKIKEEDQGPSCSLAEALEKQDLFINSTLAQFGCNLLWKLIRERELTIHGCFVNLESFIVNPLNIN